MGGNVEMGRKMVVKVRRREESREGSDEGKRSEEG
jgi:hypothetical protein